MIFLMLLLLDSSWSCFDGCIIGRYGCYCESVCSCIENIFDCDDGPSGDGACVCHSGKWNQCNLSAPVRYPVQLMDHQDWGNMDPSVSRSSRIVPFMYSRIQPLPLHGSEIVFLDNEAIGFLGLNSGDPKLQQVFSGNSLFQTPYLPYALNYGGFQFGEWRGQLGDGRTMSLGRLMTPSSHTMEISLKGAGRTPFARAGDGRASLRVLARETLGSMALTGLGIPVARVLAITGSWEQSVIRDTWYDGNVTPMKAGILTRCSQSFLRFGSLELALKQNWTSSQNIISSALETTLILTSQQTHYTSRVLASDSVKRKCFFAPSTKQWRKDYFIHKVAFDLASLIAAWMSVGFVHGSMNSDNISLIGETIDLSVMNWISRWNDSFTPSFVDIEGMYRFGNQNNVALDRLIELAALLGSTFRNSLFFKRYNLCFRERFKHRLGLGLLLLNKQQEDVIIHQFLQAATRVDFHELSLSLTTLAAFETSQQWMQFVKIQTGLPSFELLETLSAVIPTHMRVVWSSYVTSAVPNIVFRDDVADQVIDDLISKRDFKKFATYAENLKKPFENSSWKDFQSDFSKQTVQQSCGAQ